VDGMAQCGSVNRDDENCDQFGFTLPVFGNNDVSGLGFRERETSEAQGRPVEVRHGHVGALEEDHVLTQVSGD